MSRSRRRTCFRQAISSASPPRRRRSRGDHTSSRCRPHRAETEGQSFVGAHQRRVRDPGIPGRSGLTGRLRPDRAQQPDLVVPTTRSGLRSCVPLRDAGLQNLHYEAALHALGALLVDVAAAPRTRGPRRGTGMRERAGDRGRSATLRRREHALVQGAGRGPAPQSLLGATKIHPNDGRSEQPHPPRDLDLRHARRPNPAPNPRSPDGTGDRRGRQPAVIENGAIPITA
jgi:hypothetical protein